ncbi:hypothetical protein [Streptomyces niveus]|uniref:hypothetical protein n=1 Tax=Streptomyces niveus TaxID=193462 RepID=UPI0003C62D8B|nr:hypothetical protein [Streptomyces niveus]EST27994.1 hypothetical protein M877_15560 [Streptomyces niveus NCIMB 11891]
MVSSPHEAMHRIFQEYPGLFSGASEVLGVDFGPLVGVTVLPTDLTEARPVERRVDTLLRVDTDANGSNLLAIESQGKKDPAKSASWAYYLSYLHTKYRLPPVLLVVCQDRATAEWAARPVDIGPPEDIKSPIVDLISQGLGTLPAAALWRKLVAVDLSFYKSPISEELRDEGRAESRAEDILFILELRGITVPEDVRGRITGCDNTETLLGWLARALTTPSAEGLFSDE